MHQDPGIKAHHVVALLDDAAPPGTLHIVLQLHAEWAVIPDGVDPAIDLRAWEDEAATLCERDDDVEIGNRGGRVGGRRAGERDRRIGGDAHEVEAYPIRRTLEGATESDPRNSGGEPEKERPRRVGEERKRLPCVAHPCELQRKGGEGGEATE